MSLLVYRRWAEDACPASDALFERALSVGAEVQDVEAAAALVAAVRHDAREQEEQSFLDGAAVRAADLVRGAGWAPLLAVHFVCLHLLR